MQKVKGVLFLLFSLSIGGVGACSLVSYGVDMMADGAKQADCKADEYIVPDAREFTFGGAYIEKYCSEITGKGQCVEITGKLTLVHPGTLRFTAETKPYMVLQLSADGGIRTIPVYATTKFNQQLNGLEQNQLVTVKGRTFALDDSLGVLLKEIETNPQ